MKLNMDQSVKSLVGTMGLIKVNARESVQEAWKMMKEHGIRHLPVSLGEDVIGLVTPRDMTRALRLNSRAKDWLQIDASDFEPGFTTADVMSTPVAIISTESSIGTAAKQMVDQQLSALLLSNHEERLVGIVTIYDLLKFLSHAPASEGSLGIADKGRLLISTWPLKQVIDEAASSGI